MNILFVTSEAYPLIKTGGLADVSASLPRALLALKQDVRILLPAYSEVLKTVSRTRQVAETLHYGENISILEAQLPGSRVKVMLVNCPSMFDRKGNPYLAENGEPWPDNALRFMLFCQVAVDIALNRIGLDWSVDVVHCNDWQSAMVPALLDQYDTHPATVFTIHNLAYQGLFSWVAFADFQLPDKLWSPDGIEFYHQFSFIKGGLNFSNMINTVSEQYSREIQTEAFGCGLHGLLQKRSDCLVGIQNGIDINVWNPGTDPLIEKKYNRRSLHKKAINKSHLQQELGLKKDQDVMLIGMINRLVSQKGLDMLFNILDELSGLPVQLAVLGSGDADYEQRLEQYSRTNPKSIAFVNGYNEALSHRIEAGSDLYLMPSQFEPCGLNQLYSLRYGTLPLVTPVGGLLDAVIDVSDEGANGFVMEEVSAQNLLSTIKRALNLFQDKDQWRKLQLQGMAQDLSWKSSAKLYLDLYRQAITRNNHK